MDFIETLLVMPSFLTKPVNDFAILTRGSTSEIIFTEGLSSMREPFFLPLNSAFF